MSLVRAFEEQATTQGHQSLIKESTKFAEELGIVLEPSFPEPKCRDKNGQKVPLDKVKGPWKGAVTAKCQEKIQEERWQGKFLSAKWEDDELNQSGYWDWLRSWSEAPSHTIAGIVEMYEQLTPTKLYTARKAKTTQVNDITCRMCGKSPENLPHVLARCLALAQNEYLPRHNAALRVLFFEKLRDLELIDAVPPWYSPVDPKPVYEYQKAKAFWDIPVYAEHSYGVDARFVDSKRKRR